MAAGPGKLGLTSRHAPTGESGPSERVNALGSKGAASHVLWTSPSSRDDARRARVGVTALRAHACETSAACAPPTNCSADQSTSIR